MSLTLIAFLLAGTPAAVTPASADFDRLEPGKSTYQQVIKTLGKPQWEYTHLAQKGTMPVLLPEKYSFSPVKKPAVDRNSLEILRVLRYPGDEHREYYAAVMRGGKLYYTIGPVPPDERTPKRVQKRYGTPEAGGEDAVAADVFVSAEVHAYRARGIAFVRDGASKTYTAKVRLAPQKRHPKKR